MAAAAVETFLFIYFRPDLSIFQPSLKSWRSVLAFGYYNGVSYAVSVACERLPQLLLGRMLSHSAVGLYERANVAANIPNKVILTSVFSIAYPALAAEIRRGGNLKEPYLRALEYITVIYWPALVLLALLACPIVSLLLGRQWLSVVPLLQIMAVAHLAAFPVMFTSPVLLALGANRHRAQVVFYGRSVSVVVLCASAYFGITAMAASKLVTVPYEMFLSLYFVRRHIDFRWHEVWSALWKSAVVSAGTAAGPVSVVALSDSGFDLSGAAMAGAALLAVAGWLASVIITQHLVLLELIRAAEAILGMRRVEALHGRITADGRRVEEATR